MKHNASRPINVCFYSKCLGNEQKPTNKCDGVTSGSIVQFDVEIVVGSCPNDVKRQTQMFQISPFEFGKNLTITVKMICSC
jgi:hypothetical protein